MQVAAFVFGKFALVALVRPAALFPRATLKLLAALLHGLPLRLHAHAGPPVAGVRELRRLLEMKDEIAGANEAARAVRRPES